MMLSFDEINQIKPELKNIQDTKLKDELSSFLAKQNAKVFSEEYLKPGRMYLFDSMNPDGTRNYWISGRMYHVEKETLNKFIKGIQEVDIDTLKNYPVNKEKQGYKYQRAINTAYKQRPLSSKNKTTTPKHRNK